MPSKFFYVKPVNLKVDKRGMFIIENISRTDFRVLFHHIEPYKDYLHSTLGYLNPNDRMRICLIHEILIQIMKAGFTNGKRLRLTQAQAIAFHETFKYEQYVGHVTHDIVCLINRKLV